MSPMRPLTYGSPVTPRNTANISRPSEELLPVRFRWVKPAASLKRGDSRPGQRWMDASEYVVGYGGSVGSWWNDSFTLASFA